MATYVSTITFTEKGMKGIQETCQRADEFRATADKMGVNVREILWTQGAIDGLILFEAPDDKSAAAAMLKLNVAGNVHTQTSRAYNATEMQQILSKV